MKRRNLDINFRLYRLNRRQKDWVRSWLFSSCSTEPYLQFTRLNPEE